MQRPIVIAYHLVWTAYGWWLPNDPRGSTSRAVASDVIAELGRLHLGRKKVQPTSPEIRSFYERAKGVLKFELREFADPEVPEIAKGFQEAITMHRYTCYACAVMPDHAHVLIRRHKHKAEQIMTNLQRASRLRIGLLGLRSEDHPVWSTGGWKAFLGRPEEVRRAIRYIQGNPIKQNLQPQKWPSVQEYDNWPLHPGHDPNSPYARRLRSWNDNHRR